MGTANTVFEVSVDGATGIVTLTQHQQIDHDVAETAPAYDDDQQFLANGLVSLTATAVTTDGDGDTASASESVDLGGGNLRFDDDGPSVTVTATAEASVVLATQDAETIGGLSDSDSSTANFSGVFSVSADGGADGAASTVVTYALSLDSGFSEGDPSGLSIGGVAINLYETNGVIVGSTSATEVGVADANTVFEVSVDGATGIVTLTQHQHVDHDVAETAPDYDDDQQSLADGLVSLTATAVTTDGDGDTASASESVDLGGGNLRFDDDGPSVTVTATAEASVVLATQDAETIGGLSDSDSSAANFSGVFSVSADGGADGAASTVVTYALSLDSGFSEGDPSGLSIGGVAINLYETSGVIVGSTSATEAGVGTANTVFEVSVDGATGIVTLTQHQQIDHDVAETAPDYDDDSSPWRTAWSC